MPYVPGTSPSLLHNSESCIGAMLSEPATEGFLRKEQPKANHRISLTSLSYVAWSRCLFDVGQLPEPGRVQDVGRNPCTSGTNLRTVTDRMDLVEMGEY